MRTINVDTVIRGLIEGDQDAAKQIADVSAMKLKHCGVAQDLSKGLRIVPMNPRRLDPLPGHKHGRPNPLAGYKKGSSDWNMAAIVDWINSIPEQTPDEVAPAGAEPTAAELQAKATRDDIVAAREALVIVHATAAARCGQQ